MTTKESLVENINLHCESISKYVMDNGEGMKHKDVEMIHESLESISARAREMIDVKEEREEEKGEEKVAQVCVLFKNKYLMAVKTERESAMVVAKAWNQHKESKQDSFISIGCDEEILMFSLSSVDAIKILFSQKDMGL